ncbi:MAG TPA: primosomal replication protein N [Gammaproteobacteria bacterium]|nr:primosomal replication protein N [Gammaproteobacteria bacterium]
MSGPANRVCLEGQVVGAPDERWTPAGLPLVRFELEHWSRAVEAGLERAVGCRMTVAALGEELAGCARTLAPGDSCRVEGFLAQRVRRRQGEETLFGRLELHAETLGPGEGPQATTE